MALPELRAPTLFPDAGILFIDIGAIPALKVNDICLVFISYGYLKSMSPLPETPIARIHGIIGAAP
jgi:hypothetical protein